VSELREKFEDEVVAAVVRLGEKCEQLYKCIDSLDNLDNLNRAAIDKNSLAIDAITERMDRLEEWIAEVDDKLEEWIAEVDDNHSMRA
jgi:hypothetical protein